ncbi:oxygen-dependent FAD-linked oxidoreductase family, partial [Rhizoctonia solani]
MLEPAVSHLSLTRSSPSVGIGIIERDSRRLFKDISVPSFSELDRVVSDGHHPSIDRLQSIQLVNYCHTGWMEPGLASSYLLVLLRGVSAKDPLSVSQSEWGALNATLGGRLGRGVPFARDCFESVDFGVGPTAPGTQCSTVQAKYPDNAFRAQLYGPRQVTQWEICQKTNEGCLLDSNNPTNSSAYSPPAVCHQGSVSPYYVDVRDPNHAVKAFEFSKRTGAGQDMDSLFIFADQNNITFIGGSWRTVGAAGGWAQGGGHSVLTNTYGLGADRVVQFKVVTPDGLYRTANACQNKDLFWALRGGGGGTFGLVLEATSEVAPKPVPTVSFSWSLTPTPENLRSFMTILVENAVRWSQEGWGGYVYTPAGIIANPLLNASQAAQSLKPITDFFKNVTNGAGGGAGSGAQGQWAEYSTFLPLFTAIVSGSGIPNPKNRAIASRLVPRSLFNPANSSALVEAALEVITRSSGTASFYFATPFLYDVKKTQQGDSSVTPAWRDAVWHALVDIEWPWDGGAEQAKATYKKASYAMDPLRKLTPGGGAYQNEADVYEPDFAQSFWGSNYAKLLDIKHKYDPDGLLDCWHCVGWKGNKTPIASCYL